ncbi:MAG: NUDIX domain-containing protein, partial [Pseudomonadota bacterium]
MTRDALIADLETYQGEAEEHDFLAPMLHLLRTEPRCFYRDCCFPGHITGSGLLMNKQSDKILLNHHKIMNIWVGFGGHADGDENIARVAQREVIEESGIEQVQFALDGIWDIDIHPIPFNA